MPWRLARNPFECSLYLDIRTVPGQSTEDIKRSLRRFLREFAAARAKPVPLLDFMVNDPPTTIAETELVAQVLAESHRAITGQVSPYIMRRTGADATHLNRYDVPCITYGPGGKNHPDTKSLMHAVGEHAHVGSLLTAAQVYVDLALTLCSKSKPRAEASA
jgi:acetylornithine deacetylase